METFVHQRTYQEIEKNLHEKIFANHIPDKDLVFRIYKNLQLNNKMTTQLKNGQKNE